MPEEEYIKFWVCPFILTMRTEVMFLMWMEKILLIITVAREHCFSDGIIRESGKQS